MCHCGPQGSIPKVVVGVRGPAFESDFELLGVPHLHFFRDKLCVDLADFAYVRGALCVVLVYLANVGGVLRAGALDNLLRVEPQTQATLGGWIPQAGRIRIRTGSGCTSCAHMRG